ncbi:hypothetical protein DESUT3_03130 [Desulfuromonas versatilis]|uniref:Uncharacterized protein n=1 Tax=Desulfuromonas versatilis TaxID=2802975 RepID=A0ABM8HM11_9BACT|nr:hypothetical protein [Desulfuromonas versatilis]BCR03244.1 hypothetical protein DESUT3_03130 [Desulfuromonas versatilis]
MKSWLLLVLALLLAGPASAQEYLSGQLIDPAGRTVAISRISARGVLSGVAGGREVAFEFAELRKIEYLGDRTCRATTRQGKTLLVEKAELRTPGQHKRVLYWTLDPATRQEREFVLGNQSFHTLSFSGKPGRVKTNPRTGQPFPPDYLFDPFTGESLQWRNPGD